MQYEKYIAPIDLYGGKVKKGDIFTKHGSPETGYAYYTGRDKVSVLPPEIVETWEKVSSFQIGNWVKFRYLATTIGKISDITITDNCIVNTSNGVVECHLGCIVLATYAEILEHLISEAKHRGFVDGLELNRVTDINNYSLRYKGKLSLNKWNYITSIDALTNNHATIYKDGIWSTIEPEIKVITLRCTDGTFDLQVSEKGIYFPPEDIWLNITELKTAILPTLVSYRSIRGNGSYIYSPTHLNSGCKKAVPIEDWQKVLIVYEGFQSNSGQDCTVG